MKKTTVLTAGLVLALLGFAEPAIKDGSVLGYWTFDDGVQSADVSGYGGGLIQLKDGVSIEHSGGYSGGCLGISASGGKTATASLANGLSLNTDKFTIVMRMKRSSAMSKLPESGWGMESTDKQFAKNFNDATKWHLLTVRGKQKDAGVGASHDYGYMCDPEDITSSSRPETAGDELGFLVSVSGQNVTFGGSLKGYAYQGGIDEVMVINRMMSKSELQRLYRTGETYIFPKEGQYPQFSSSGGWSSDEGTLHLPPGDMPGAAYIMDGDLWFEIWNSATFGGDLSKKVSLTLGRLAPLVNGLNGDTLVSQTDGNILQHDGVALAFYDLRLNDGRILTQTGNTFSLATTLLDVGAPAAKPFALEVVGNYALNVDSATTGSGVLAKKGTGILTVSKWTGTAKLRLAEGSIKTPRLDGYAGGTVIVDGDAVTFTGADTLSGTIQVRYDGTIAAAEATYPVLNAPTLTSASQVAVSATIPEKYEGATKLDNGVVSLVVTKTAAPVPAEDKGTKPMLIWQ